MATIDDTDLMLINRGGVSYSVTGEEVKNQLGGGGGSFEIEQLVPSRSSYGAGWTNARYDEGKFLLWKPGTANASASDIGVYDGEAWYPGAGGWTQTIRSICYGNGYYLSTGDNNNANRGSWKAGDPTLVPILFSDRVQIGPYNWGAGSFIKKGHNAENFFLVGGSSGGMYTATDAMTWVSIPGAPSYRFIGGVSYSEDLGIYMGRVYQNSSRSLLVTSPDLVTWTTTTLDSLVSTPYNLGIGKPVDFNGGFVYTTSFLGTGAKVQFTKDGINAEPTVDQVYNTDTGIYEDLVGGGESIQKATVNGKEMVFVVIGPGRQPDQTKSSVMYSEDGMNWKTNNRLVCQTYEGSVSADNVKDMAIGEDIFIVTLDHPSQQGGGTGNVFIGKNEWFV